MPAYSTNFNIIIIPNVTSYNLHFTHITHILSCLDTVTRRHPSSGIIIMGDFNHMKDNLLKRYPLTQTVKSPTHGTSILDCVYSNISGFFL